MHVERGQRSKGGERKTLRHPGKTGEQRDQGVGNEQNNASAARCQHRYIARELNGIAQPFVGADHNGLAVDGFFSKPFGLGEVRVRLTVGSFPSRLTAGPAGSEIPGQQVQNGDDSSRSRHCRGQAP